MEQLDRRRFLILGSATLGALAAGCAGPTAPAADYAGQPPIDVGPASAYGPGMHDRWARSAGFFIANEGGRIFALSSTCTHRRCPLLVAGREIECDCHGSRFTPQGQVVTGPATVSLPRFGIRRTSAGTLEIDRSKVFPKEQWDDPRAFVAA